MLPLAPRCRFHLLVFLVHQEVFHSQSPCFPDSALSAAHHSVRWVRTTECAAALLVTNSWAGLLHTVPTLMCLLKEWKKNWVGSVIIPFILTERHPDKVTYPGLIVQLLSKILIHSSPASLDASSFSSSCTAAPTVASVENAALSSRVDWKRGRHGLTAARPQLSVPIHLRGDAINAAVTIFTSLAQNTWDVLSARETVKPGAIYSHWPATALELLTDEGKETDHGYSTVF